MRTIAAVLLVLTLAGCGTAQPKAPATITVSGRFFIEGNNSLTMETPAIGVACFGYHGYDNIKQGAQITIADGAGTTVALGTLPEGRLTNMGTSTRECMFAFTVPNVPTGKGFYTVSIEGHGKKYSEADTAYPLTLSVGP
jgi:ABC-type Fe3+-hydroxamate transport system substrate-binding protein